MTVHFRVFGLQRMIRDIEQIGDRPRYRVIYGLESTLRAAFQDTQQRVHIITGSLRLSGRSESDFDGVNWMGEIVYGGPSAGPNDPVTYAIYEMARGGDHDFMRGMPNFFEGFETAMMRHFDVL